MNYRKSTDGHTARKEGNGIKSKQQRQAELRRMMKLQREKKQQTNDDLQENEVPLVTPTIQRSQLPVAGKKATSILKKSKMISAATHPLDQTKTVENYGRSGDVGLSDLMGGYGSSSSDDEGSDAQNKDDQVVEPDIAASIQSLEDEKKSVRFNDAVQVKILHPEEQQQSSRDNNDDDLSNTQLNHDEKTHFSTTTTRDKMKISPENDLNSESLESKISTSAVVTKEVWDDFHSLLNDDHIVNESSSTDLSSNNIISSTSLLGKKTLDKQKSDASSYSTNNSSQAEKSSIDSMVNKESKEQPLDVTLNDDDMEMEQTLYGARLASLILKRKKRKRANSMESSSLSEPYLASQDRATSIEIGAKKDHTYSISSQTSSNIDRETANSAVSPATTISQHEKHLQATNINEIGVSRKKKSSMLELILKTKKKKRLKQQKEESAEKSNEKIRNNPVVLDWRMQHM
mmetsp:Transcript_55561/g.67007  ORF Transcript_55561/g.67007 Transcript_55561/m.67007 type:complete len:460 (-) Transcript_55561:53-1432(-)